MTPELSPGLPRIKVVGAGCAGTNMVDWLAKLKIQGAELIAVDTEYVDLFEYPAQCPIRVYIMGKVNVINI